MTPRRPEDERDREVEFISEPIEPERGSFSTELMSQGLAALPAAFTWRKRRYEIVECLEHMKQSSREGHNDTGESYLRRQQFVVLLNNGQKATIYVERSAGRGVSARRARQLWYLYTLE